MLDREAHPSFHQAVPHPLSTQCAGSREEDQLAQRQDQEHGLHRTKWCPGPETEAATRNCCSVQERNVQCPGGYVRG